MPIKSLPFKRDEEEGSEDGLAVCGNCRHHIIPVTDGKVLHTNGVVKAIRCPIMKCFCARPSAVKNQ